MGFGLFGCDASWMSESSLTFRKNVVPPFLNESIILLQNSGYNSLKGAFSRRRKPELRRCGNLKTLTQNNFFFFQTFHAQTI
jgi:hypothetical protein